MSNRIRSRKDGDTFAIFVHAGAGYHSTQNEEVHLLACNDAARAAMKLLADGGSALDAVEIAIKMLEDREITNAGYGSNLTIDGVVECDALVVDHHGRSGAVGAAAQIKNPVSLARLVYEHSNQQLSLRRVPPNLLVAQGATDFAFSQGMAILPHDILISPGARERWLKWKTDIKQAERRIRPAEMIGTTPETRRCEPGMFEGEKYREQIRREHMRALLDETWNIVQNGSTPSEWDAATRSSPSESRSQTHNHLGQDFDFIDEASIHRSCGDYIEASHSAFVNSTQQLPTMLTYGTSSDACPDYMLSNSLSNVEKKDRSDPLCLSRCLPNSTAECPIRLKSRPPTSNVLCSLLETQEACPRDMRGSHSNPSALNVDSASRMESGQSSGVNSGKALKEDHITDTVGAIAIDGKGHIACAASSGGIGMKFRGRIGPAAMVGVGAAVIPVDPDDKSKTCVGAVTSGTGEHMATTMAATVCVDRLYRGKKKMGNDFVDTDDDTALQSMIQTEFMGHPSVVNSVSAGAIGILSVKKTREGICFYFAHNTESFALASMHADEKKPICTMSRSRGNGTIAQGGRAIRFRRKR